MKWCLKPKLNESKIFRGEIAPSEHIAQFYADDSVFLDALTNFVASGLTAGESVIVIATPEHLRALRERLIWAKVDLASAIINDRYITLNAATALSAFLVEGWPDDKLFQSLVSHLLDRAAAKTRRVRAFGEMVALLWVNGNVAATVRLEQMWNRFCDKNLLTLFCAYPSAGFSGDCSQPVAEICAAHSRVIGLSDAEGASAEETLAQPQAAD